MSAYTLCAHRCVPFASDLFRSIGIDAEIAFIRLKSYEGTSTTGNVKQVLGLTENIEGRHVIVVEDIVDTGHTICNLLKDLNAKNPASIKVATLLFKPQSEQCGVVPDYVGFEIPKNLSSDSASTLMAWPAIFVTYMSSATKQMTPMLRNF